MSHDIYERPAFKKKALVFFLALMVQHCLKPRKSWQLALEFFQRLRDGESTSRVLLNSTSMNFWTQQTHGR